MIDRLDEIARLVFNHSNDPEHWSDPLSVIARDNAYITARNILAVPSDPPSQEASAPPIAGGR